MPKPCALSRVGTPAHSTSAYLTHARIRFVPGWPWRGGGIGWPTVALAPILVKPMRHNASALFRATFGVAPRAAASAPGRVNLIGEHTDYNGGPVLPVATPLRTTVAVGPADAGVLELISTLDGERARIDWREGRATGWSAYLAGVMRELDTVGAAPAGAGARVAVASDVPVGAGLASSAALTVAAAKALSLLASVRLSPRQLAGVAFRAEHDYVGVGCGIMDQMCAALARPGHALLLECASLAARRGSTWWSPPRDGRAPWARGSPVPDGAAPCSCCWAKGMGERGGVRRRSPRGSGARSRPRSGASRRSQR